ncbi:hypothetical protein GCM10029978_007640 [Actinoallomurus acanthiterrae]
MFLLVRRYGETSWTAALLPVSVDLLERDVAVKELHLPAGDGAESANRLRRVMREARTIARVSHPHVVEIHDLVEYERRLWIVMELVDGPSLAHLITLYGPMYPQRAASLGLQLLEALQAVHAAGALHRDVKPANVLVRPDGSAVLTDFGIVALNGDESLTETGALIGSADYMAPERLTDGAVGPASDLWSLGVTLCAMVSRDSPFRRSEMAASLHAAVFGEPAIPPQAGPLRAVLKALLRKSPDQRPSATEVAVALRQVADGLLEPAPAGQTTLTAGTGLLPPVENRRRRRWPMVTSALLLPAVVVAAGLYASRTPPFRGRTTVSKTTVIDAGRTWQQAEVPVRKGDAVMVRYVRGTWTVDYRGNVTSGPQGYGSTDDASVTSVAASCKVNATALRELTRPHHHRTGTRIAPEWQQVRCTRRSPIVDRA